MTELETGRSIETQPHRQLVDAGVVLSILMESERERPASQQGTTDVEYMEWVHDVVKHGFSADHHVMKDAAELHRIASGLDDYFDHPHGEAQPPLSAQLLSIAGVIKGRYEEKVKETLIELNDFLAQHDQLFIVQKTGEALTELTVERTEHGTYELPDTLRRAALAMDILQLPQEHQRIVQKVANDPELYAIYA